MILSRNDITPGAMEAELAELADRIDVPHITDALRFPKFFQVETTRLCNARCPFCAIDQWDKSVPFMSDALWEKIAAELIQWRDWVRFVDLQREGEPLLDKKIFDRVRQLKEGGMHHVTMTTNASALTARNARKLLEAGVDELMLSIDSIDQDKYEKSRVGLDYHQVMENARRYFRLRDEINPKSSIRIRGVCTFDPAGGRAEIDRWEEYWFKYKKPHDRVYMQQIHNWGNQIDADRTAEMGRDVYHPCIIPFSTMHISAMGTVALCCHDFDAVTKLGDINTQSIEEVWQAQKLQEVRRLHSTGERNQIEFCKGCRSFDEAVSLEREKENPLTIRRSTRLQREAEAAG